MRTILFHGKTLFTNEWKFGGYATMDGRHFIVDSTTYPDNTCSWGAYEVYPNSVGQFTGQFDAAGDPIHEGDIVYVPSEDEYANISWDVHMSKFTINFDGWFSDFDHFSGKDLEVRGNTFDEGWHEA